MAIKHVRLGKHGALVSNLCLGTMNFGWVTSEEESFRIMDRALGLALTSSTPSMSAAGLSSTVRRKCFTLADLAGLGWGWK